MSFVFDRTWNTDATPEQLWTAVCDTDSLAREWSWLANDGLPPISEGEQVTAVVRPPLPYELRFDLRIREVHPRRDVVVDVGGDVSGEARLTVKRARPGAELRILWDLEMRRPLLRLLESTVPGVLRWGHEWVVATALEQAEARHHLDLRCVAPMQDRDRKKRDLLEP